MAISVKVFFGKNNKPYTITVKNCTNQRYGFLAKFGQNQHANPHHACTDKNNQSKPVGMNIG